MMIIEVINVAACLVMLVLVWRVAVAVHLWRHKLPVVAVSIVLGMQVIDPLARWLPAVLWTTVAVNVTLAILSVLWRNELWALLRYKLHLDQQALDRRMRRSTDFSPLTGEEGEHHIAT